MRERALSGKLEYGNSKRETRIYGNQRISTNTFNPRLETAKKHTSETPLNLELEISTKTFNPGDISRCASEKIPFEPRIEHQRNSTSTFNS